MQSTIWLCKSPELLRGKAGRKETKYAYARRKIRLRPNFDNFVQKFIQMYILCILTEVNASHNKI